MINSKWQRFYGYERMLLYSFIISLLILFLNEELKMFPFQFPGYLFWLTLGLYLGFRIAKQEIARVYKKQADSENRSENFFHNN